MEGREGGLGEGGEEVGGEGGGGWGGIVGGGRRTESLGEDEVCEGSRSVVWS